MGSMNATSSLPTGPLSAERIAAFQRHGFVIVPLFSEDDFVAVKREISDHLDARARALHAEGLIRELHADAPFETRFALLAAQCDEIHGGNDTTDILGDALFRFMRHPRLLDAIAALVGPEISLNPIQHLRAKPPAAAGRRIGFYEVPWHQDSGVTTADSDGALLITAWIPLGGASETMGCLRLIPGFHRRGHVRHVSDPAYGTTIDPALLPADGHVSGACRPGEIVLMSQFTPHSSTPNLSQVCRWSLDLRYQATGSPSGRAGHPSTTVRSLRDPTAEVNDPAVWRAAWKAALAKPGSGGCHRIG